MGICISTLSLFFLFAMTSGSSFFFPFFFLSYVSLRLREGWRGFIFSFRLHIFSPSEGRWQIERDEIASRCECGVRSFVCNRVGGGGGGGGLLFAPASYYCCSSSCTMARRGEELKVGIRRLVGGCSRTSGACSFCGVGVWSWAAERKSGGPELEMGRDGGWREGRETERGRK